MTVHCFVGPSLTRPAWNGTGADVVVHGPVKHGDLLSLDVAPGDAVAIVDGLFYTQAAVRHKEILDVMSRGAVVVGGGSMGALRAAELSRFGMIGIGRVFELLESAELLADDEVAILHADAEAGYRPLSVALVCLREACTEMVTAGLLTAEQRAALIVEMAGRFFGDRTLHNICVAGRTLGLPDRSLDALIPRLDGTLPDVKARDAQLVLDAAIDLSGAGPAMPCHWETDSVVEWRDVFALEEVGRPSSDRLTLRGLQLVSPAFAEFYSTVVRERLAATWRTDTSPAALAEEFVRRTGIESVDTSLSNRWLYPPDHGASPETILRLAVCTYREAPGLPPTHALLGRLVPSRAALTAVRDGCERAVRRTSAQTPVDAETTLRWVAELWSVPADPDVVRRAGYARGFSGVAQVLLMAQRLAALRDDPDALGTLRRASLDGA